MAALGVAAPAGAQALRGTVVHHNRHGHSFAVAAHDGSLHAVHARRLPAVGRVVRVDARRLGNGTFAASHVHGRGRRGHTHLLGTITYVDPSGKRLVLSSNGVSLLMRTSRRGGVHAASHEGLPAMGTVVDVSAVLPAGGMPIAQDITPVGTDFTVKVEGNVVAVDATARTITITADDDDQSGAQLTIAVPDPAIDLTQIAPGDEVELLVALHSDGTYVLLGLAGDDDGEHADDPGDQQGRSCGGDDNGGDHRGHGDHGEQGDTGGDDGGGDGQGDR
ncbi:MAG TPA: hypothetical protein VE972_04980 [Conexibacter sp.]|nr:hypothetical protein [Conexibacter sp.]